MLSALLLVGVLSSQSADAAPADPWASKPKPAASRTVPKVAGAAAAVSGIVAGTTGVVVGIVSAATWIIIYANHRDHEGKTITIDLATYRDDDFGRWLWIRTFFIATYAGVFGFALAISGLIVAAGGLAACLASFLVPTE